MVVSRELFRVNSENAAEIEPTSNSMTLFERIDTSINIDPTALFLVQVGVNVLMLDLHKLVKSVFR